MNRSDNKLELNELLRETWHRVSGSQLPIAGAALVYAVLAYIAQAIVAYFFPITPIETNEEITLQMLTAHMSENENILAQIAQTVLTMPISTPLLAGMMFLGIMRATDQEIEVTMVFDFFVKVWPLVFLSISIHVLVYAGLMLFILPGVYLFVAYMFAIPLMIDKDLSIWDALETSRKAVTKRWFDIFLAQLIMFFAFMFGMMTFGIGFIWSAPFIAILYGVLYRELFIEQEHTLKSDNSSLHYG